MYHVGVCRSMEEVLGSLVSQLKWTCPYYGSAISWSHITASENPAIKTRSSAPQVQYACHCPCYIMFIVMADVPGGLGQSFVMSQSTTKEASLVMSQDR